MNENKLVNWIPVIELAVLAFTTLGTTITLYMHTDAKMERSISSIERSMDSQRKETYAILEGIRSDMREFHEEMKTIHGRMCTLEERYFQSKKD